MRGGRACQGGGPIESIDWRAFDYYRRLGRARDFVETHLGEPISLRDVASAAGLETAYFSHFFHEKTGIFFRDWLAHLRVRRAIALMSTRNFAISRVAMECGFADLRTFERVFKKWMGVTPLSFKKAARP